MHTSDATSFSDKIWDADGNYKPNDKISFNEDSCVTMRRSRDSVLQAEWDRDDE